MRKQFSGSLIMVQLLSFFMSTIVSTSVHCMDSIYTDALHDIIIYHIIPNVDCRMQRTLAVLSTQYNQNIEDNYRPNKKRIEQLMLENKSPIIRGQGSWNKDFNRCAWVTIAPLENGTKKLTLFLVKLTVDKDVSMHNYTWSHYMQPVIDDTVRPFFNEKGDTFCYGYGLYGFCNRNKAVIKYSIQCDGTVKDNRCVFSIKENEIDHEYHCNWLLNFPVLLRAFLQSTHVCEKSITSWDWVEVYDMGGVSIPEDYKHFKSHVSARFLHYQSYDNLYCCIRKAIDGRYAQQREKLMIENK